ncbi:MAG: hypothetical protein FVQ80_12415 [Planctomycetes bacterium]|nr:hypothetical protein [Planctomycetota bacterium]
MKQSPQMQKLEEILRQSKLSAHGFLGSDKRNLSEIIDTDIAQVARFNVTPSQIAEKMQQITDTAIKGLGTWVEIDDKRLAKVDEAKGSIVCPWPHPAKFAKRVTTMKIIETGDSQSWSDLNIHLIARHSFFEGKGSDFRIEPEKLIALLFESQV